MLLRRFVKLSRHLSSGAKVENFARCSRLFQPNSFTKLEAKQGLCKSQKLMLDYGLISPSGTGAFVLLPLATKSLQRLVGLIDSELQRVGGQKIQLPCLVPGSLFKKTGEWEDMGDELFTLKDRRDHDYCLGPTHEEAVSQLLASLPSLSLRCLPILLYQVGPKFRDEGRPRYGLLRGREFTMKGKLSSSNVVKGSAGETYDVVCGAYSRILQHLGVPFVKVKASTGAMGGNYSHEFHFQSDIGEDRLFLCSKCQIGVSADEVDSDTDDQCCDQCGGPLKEGRGVEVAHAFSLGTIYSDPLKANFMDSDGKNNKQIAGCLATGKTGNCQGNFNFREKSGNSQAPMSSHSCFLRANFAEKLQLGKDKVGYTICHGTASYFRNKLLSSLASVQFVVSFDESLNKVIQKQQMDLSGRPSFLQSTEPMPLFELHDVYQRSVTEVTQSELLHFFQHGRFREKIGACL
ncbi:unnamed protein product [Ixodes hexagonus]